MEMGFPEQVPPPDGARCLLPGALQQEGTWSLGIHSPRGPSANTGSGASALSCLQDSLPGNSVLYRNLDVYLDSYMNK